MVNTALSGCGERRGRTREARDRPLTHRDRARRHQRTRPVTRSQRPPPRVRRCVTAKVMRCLLAAFHDGQSVPGPHARSRSSSLLAIKRSPDCCEQQRPRAAKIHGDDSTLSLGVGGRGALAPCSRAAARSAARAPAAGGRLLSIDLSRARKVMRSGTSGPSRGSRARPRFAPARFARVACAT